MQVGHCISAFVDVYFISGQSSRLRLPMLMLCFLLGDAFCENIILSSDDLEITVRKAAELREHPEVDLEMNSPLF